MAFTIEQVTHHPEMVFDAELGVMDFPFCSKSSRPAPVCFARGDSDGNTGIDLTDAIVVVQNIFLGKLNRIDCDDALDINDDGLLDTTDPLVLLSWLFLAGEDPPPPFLECGPDPTDDELSCKSFAACEGNG